MLLSKLKKYIDEIYEVHGGDFTIKIEVNNHIWDENFELDVKDVARRSLNRIVLVPSKRAYTVKEEQIMKDLQTRCVGLDRRIDIEVEDKRKLRDKIEKLEEELEYYKSRRKGE